MRVVRLGDLLLGVVRVVIARVGDSETCGSAVRVIRSSCGCVLSRWDLSRCDLSGWDLSGWDLSRWDIYIYIYEWPSILIPEKSL